MSRSFTGYLLFGTALSLALAVVFWKGSPEPFFLLPFKALLTLFISFLLLASLSTLKKKRFTQAMLHLLCALFLIFYAANEYSFKWEYLELPSSGEQLFSTITDETIVVTNHTHISTETLKNFEKADFLINNSKFTASLNYPVRLEKERKIFVTGSGDMLLLTESHYLLILSFLSILISAFIFAFALKKNSH